MDFDQRYLKLNKNQRLAVDTIDGPLLVIAGPGSGKTEILSMRVGKILKETDTPANSILCLTFTDAASLNMRERLSSLIGSDAYKVLIYTFHGFCTDIISSYPEYFFSGASFNPADDVTRRKILEDIFENMDFKNPLRSHHSEQGFVFLGDCLSSISDIKRAGLTPDDFDKLIEHNKISLDILKPLIDKYIPQRISKKDLENFEKFKFELENTKFPEKPFHYIESLRESLLNSLSDCINKAKEEDSSKPLSFWKERFITKGDNSFVLKDQKNLDKLLALSSVYKDYNKKLFEMGFFDFDDMIIEVLTKLENDPVFLSIISERFQYILVDEFQDTNDAQIRLLWSLTSSPVNENRPNIMAVGDDDQAIFRFQGAEVLNMINFIKRYRDPKVVSLNENYRSTKDILDFSESVINLSDFSLRKLFPDIEKKIISSNKNIKNGNIHLKNFPDILSEYYFIADEIVKLKDQGFSYSDIAVISRKHNLLKDLIPYLHSKKIPISYEKKNNVLNDPIVLQIIKILRFIESTLKGSGVKDEILPEILSFPFWGIESSSIWNISIKSSSEKLSWLEVMKSSNDKKIENVADFLIDLSVKANSQPAERVIDMIVGSKSQNDDEFLDEKINYNSPLRDFYFSEKKLDNNRAQYISFLSSLKIFIEAVRQYRPRDLLTVGDVLDFVDIYIKNDLEIVDNSFYTEGDDCINLMTAHKSKGLEFPIVFILSATQDTWVSSVRNSKISFPSNIKVRPSADSLDDKIRLFYVALTRAKHTLYITSHHLTNDGKKVLLTEFLNSKIDSFTYHTFPNKVEILETFYDKELFITNDHKKILAPLLKNYQMSVTHLNNFLNIISSGPKVFLEQNILHFPQAKSASSVYGTAIHECIAYIYIFLKKEGYLPDRELVFKKAQEVISLGKLSSADFDHNLDKAVHTLGLYMEKNIFDKNDLIETNFKKEGVVLGNCHIVGKIDKMRLQGGDILVSDFKTGKPFKSWEEKDLDGKIISYKRQLLFYKLLVENSSTFSKYKVSNGFIEFLDWQSDFSILNLEIKEEDALRLQSLIEVVYKKIINLDFPDITKYPQSLEGILQFEDDLLNQ